MSTATGSNVFEQLDSLRKDAELLGNQHQDLLRQAQEAMSRRNEALKKIGEIATQIASSTDVIASTNVSVSSAATATTDGQKRRGRPAGSDSKNKATATTDGQKRRGRPAGSKNKPKDGNAQTESTEPKRRGRFIEGNDMTLKEAVWNALDRKPSSYKNYLPDYPVSAGAHGLKIKEIETVIKADKLWSTNSDTASNQIQQAIYKLREEGKVVRAEDKRYSIVEGATLDGPSLDEKGKPVS